MCRVLLSSDQCDGVFDMQSDGQAAEVLDEVGEWLMQQVQNDQQQLRCVTDIMRHAADNSSSEWCTA